MGLTYCEECSVVEGKTQEDENGNTECGYCGELITFVREHDDCDMGR